MEGMRTLGWWSVKTRGRKMKRLDRKKSGGETAYGG